MNICAIFAKTQTNRARNLQIYIHETWLLGLSSNGVNGCEQIRFHDDLLIQRESQEFIQITKRSFNRIEKMYV